MKRKLIHESQQHQNIWKRREGDYREKKEWEKRNKKENGNKEAMKSEPIMAKNTRKHKKIYVMKQKKYL